MKPLIKLRIKHNIWVAEYVDNKEIFDLFGVYELPTPYTNLMEGYKVVNLLQAKNPEYKVIIG